MPTDQTTEGRIKLLEAHVEVQEEMLAAIQAERIEAERLNDSVLRLGAGATDLGAALLKVDQTQQMLTRLGRDLSRVEEASATTHEVEAKVVKAKQEADEKIRAAKLEADRQVRRTQFQRNLIIAAIVLVAAMAGAAWYSLHERQERAEYARCLENQATVAGVNQFLTAVSQNSLVPEIKQSATDLVTRFGQGRACEEP